MHKKKPQWMALRNTRFFQKACKGSLAPGLPEVEIQSWRFSALLRIKRIKLPGWARLRMGAGWTLLTCLHTLSLLALMGVATCSVTSGENPLGFDVLQYCEHEQDQGQ